MKWSLARRHRLQMGLYHPPRKTPEWRTLPPEVRGKATLLLVQMLRQHLTNRSAFKKTQEVSDE